MSDSLDQNTHAEEVQIVDTTAYNKQVADTRVSSMGTIKKRQKILLWGIGSCLMGGMVIYGWVAMRETSLNHKQEFKNSLTTGSSRINPQEAWFYQFRNDAELAKKRLDAMENMLTNILKLHNTSKTSEAKIHGGGDPSSRDTPQPSKDPAELIGTIREDLKVAQANNDSKTLSGTVLPPSPEGLSSQRASKLSSLDHTGKDIGYLTAENTRVENMHVGNTRVSSTSASPHFRSKTVRKISLSLRNARNNLPLKTVDNTIPAGAFAKAILLGGVDASASIQASSDPRPALLRVMDAGTLPRKFHSDLMGCHALAACYGDISSERVFMRLEKLTCTERKTGEIVEVKVQGYVAGEDGRTGIRGVVVDRAGESMRNAMMGGFIGGIGEFLSQSRSAVTFSPMAGLAQTNPMGMNDLLKHGAGKGINSALDKYADFYIKRAEQVQPVIQVAAGRQVDIVFTEGISLSESLYRQALGRSNDQGRYHQIQTINEEKNEPQQPVSDWIGSSNQQ